MEQIGCEIGAAAPDNGQYGSITLQLHGDEKTATLVEHGDPPYGYPKFRWINDKSLIIDLGKVSWVSPKTGKVGSIHITMSIASWW